ncbi:MAG: ribonuclease HII [Anaerolineales bacterium]|nr:ribonuclease HII [Anaerolineales bacterium]
MPGLIRTPCPTLNRERRLLRRGCTLIAGLDEAGRGAWAGPLSAGAVILPLRLPGLRAVLSGIRDSKQMTPRQRTLAAGVIRSVAVAWAVGSATAAEVDRIGPLRATHLAMRRAVDGLTSVPDHLLIDYLRLPGITLPQTAITHGDALSLSIAAASILAKTWRDELMTAMDARYPGYGFAAHKGYGTSGHSDGLARLGACPEHRRSYAPVRRVLESSPV